MSQIQGVGQVFVGGSSSPAVRVELNPLQLASSGVGLEAVRTALAGANANRPKGAFQDKQYRWPSTTTIRSSSQRLSPIIVGHNPQTGAAVRVEDVGTVSDSVSNILNAGVAGINPVKGPPGKLTDAISLMVSRSCANVISTVDNVMAEMPHLQAAIPPTIRSAWLWTARSPFAPACMTLRFRSSSACAGGVCGLYVSTRGMGDHYPSVAVPLSLWRLSA